MLIRFWLLILMSVWWPGKTPAAELYENYNSIRAMGMGNAFTAVVDNEEALMYNPAALCRVSGVNFNLINPSAGIEGLDLVSSMNSLASASTEAETARALREFFGKRASLQISILPIFSVPCIGVGLLGNFQLTTVLSNPAFPNLNIRAIADAGLGFGFGIPIIPKVFYVGLTTRYLMRYGADFPLGVSTIAALSTTELRNSIANSGFGFASDLGALLTIPGPVSPTVGVAWRNIGDTTFIKSASSTSAPPKAPQEIAVGASMALDAYVLKVVPSLEIKHLTAETTQLGKKLHAGMEIQLPFVSLRGGLHQGYYTYGGGIDLGIARIEAATWGVEMGEYPGQDESRRYAVQAVVNLSLDANFSFDFKFNMRRKVKQRR